MGGCSAITPIPNCYTYVGTSTCAKCATGYGLNAAATGCVKCVTGSGTGYAFTGAVSCDWDVNASPSAAPAGICQNGKAATSGAPCGTATQIIAAEANCAVAFQTGSDGNSWVCTQCATDNYFETMGVCSQGPAPTPKCHWTC